jgi:hypothetical protein
MSLDLARETQIHRLARLADDAYVLAQELASGRSDAYGQLKLTQAELDTRAHSLVHYTEQLASDLADLAKQKFDATTLSRDILSVKLRQLADWIVS